MFTKLDKSHGNIWWYHIPTWSKPTETGFTQEYSKVYVNGNSFVPKLIGCVMPFPALLFANQ